MVEAFADTDSSHLKVVSPSGSPEEPLTFPVWRRQGSELAKVFDKYKKRANSFANLGVSSVPLEVPEEYVPFALRLKDGWGLQDIGQPREVGMMPYSDYQKVYSYDLYEGGVENGRHVATVTPNSLDRFGMVRVRSAEAASQILQILFDAKNRQDAELTRLHAPMTEEEKAKRAQEAQKPSFVPRAVGSVTVPGTEITVDGKTATVHTSERTGMLHFYSNSGDGMYEIVEKTLREALAKTK